MEIQDPKFDFSNFEAISHENLRKVGRRIENNYVSMTARKDMSSIIHDKETTAVDATSVRTTAEPVAKKQRT
jgi:hypothetical protein